MKVIAFFVSLALLFRLGVPYVIKRYWGVLDDSD